ncbi:MAG TPA: GNAT family protein [Nitrososphaeraceae archaeon]|nr:GNAT family protein [Nitrososphaeraceae archaeon]
MTHLSFPYLSGKLVNLRELSMNDATTIVSLMDYEIAKYLYEVPFPYKLNDALNFIKSSYDNFQLHKAITFGIEYKNILESKPLLVGTIGIKDIHYLHKKSNIGYWIGKQYQGKGIATECIKIIVNYVFDELKIEEISAYVFPDNNPSIRVLEKNGFIETRKVNEYHPLSNRYRNSLIYTIKNSNNKLP